MIVIIIVGILAGLALPQYFRVAEKARAAEGTNLLGILRSAEIRHYSEKSGWANALNQLDVEFTTSKYFETITVGYSDSDVANLSRNSTDNPGYGGYKLTISKDGVISCSRGVGNACSKLGY